MHRSHTTCYMQTTCATVWCQQKGGQHIEVAPAHAGMWQSEQSCFHQVITRTASHAQPSIRGQSMVASERSAKLHGAARCLLSGLQGSQKRSGELRLARHTLHNAELNLETRRPADGASSPAQIHCNWKLTRSALHLQHPRPNTLCCVQAACPVFYLGQDHNTIAKQNCSEELQAAHTTTSVDHSTASRLSWSTASQNKKTATGEGWGSAAVKQLLPGRSVCHASDTTRHHPIPRAQRCYMPSCLGPQSLPQCCAATMLTCQNSCK
jgi:hypothetical protein